MRKDLKQRIKTGCCKKSNATQRLPSLQNLVRQLLFFEKRVIYMALRTNMSPLAKAALVLAFGQVSAIRVI